MAGISENPATLSTFCLLFKILATMLVNTIINSTGIIGGPWGDRTPDLGIKSPLLYQLS